MTFVLIPGAGGDGRYWRPVVDELRRRGRDALPIDLPGDDDTKDIPDYARVVVEAIGDRRDVILVAQSMAGFVAPLVCERVPVRMVVLVNAMIPSAGERAGEWWDNTGQAAARRENDEREGRDPDAPFDPATYFFHDVPSEIAEEAMQDVRPQSNTPFASSWTAPAWPDVPTRVVIGHNDRFFPREFQRRVALQRLQVTPDEIEGGHLVALSRPTMLADRLEAYAGSIAGSPA